MDDTEPQSGDFMVLNSTTQETGSEWGGATAERQVNERNAAIFKLCGICGPDDGTRRPLRIVVVGKHGAGKSSFINGVAAALSEDSWHEYAYTGDHGRGAPITIVNQRHEKCCNGHRQKYRGILLPTLIDVAGMSDESEDKLEELLRLLFYGHIEEDEAVMKVYEDCKRSSTDQIRQKYSQSFPDMRVDRVVFVASAADELPERLMTCVLRAARPSHDKDVRRAVPMYGVLTKRDKVDVTSTAFLDTKKRFMQHLGLNQSRFLLCSNYCDDLDHAGLRTQQLSPELDLPYVYFMHKLCDRALKVIREDETLPGSGRMEEEQNARNAEQLPPDLLGRLRQAWRNVDTSYQDCVTSVLVGVAVLLVLFTTQSSGFQGSATLREACNTGAIRDLKYNTLLCQEQSSWAIFFRQLLVQLFAAFLLSVLFFVYRQLNRRP